LHFGIFPALSLLRPRRGLEFLLPRRAPEGLAARRHRFHLAHELPQAHLHDLADRLGQGGRSFREALEQRLDRFLAPVAVVKEARLAMPDHGLLAAGDAVAELEVEDLAVEGLPDEQVEIVVVEPAALCRRLVRQAYDFM